MANLSPNCPCSLTRCCTSILENRRGSCCQLSFEFKFQKDIYDVFSSAICSTVPTTCTLIYSRKDKVWAFQVLRSWAEIWWALGPKVKRILLQNCNGHHCYCRWSFDQKIKVELYGREVISHISTRPVMTETFRMEFLLFQSCSSRRHSLPSYKSSSWSSWGWKCTHWREITNLTRQTGNERMSKLYQFSLHVTYMTRWKSPRLSLWRS